MGNRGSQSVHDTHYNWLVDIYGETCLICNKPPPPGQRLDIDHISYDADLMWQPSNISLLDHECNCYLRGVDEASHRRIIEHHRALRVRARASEREKQDKLRRQGVTMPGVDNEIAREFGRVVKKTGENIPLPDFSIKEVLDYMNGSPEMKANARYHRSFSVWLWKYLIQNGPMPRDEVLNAGSAVTGANQTTLKRYLDAFCANVPQAALTKIDYGGEWKVYFKDPVKARKISGKKEKKP